MYHSLLCIYKSAPFYQMDILETAIPKKYTSPIFFFFPFIFISRRLITLQYCSGFCHTLTWVSHGFICIPLPDPNCHCLYKICGFGQDKGKFFILFIWGIYIYSLCVFRDSGLFFKEKSLNCLRLKGNRRYKMLRHECLRA